MKISMNLAKGILRVSRDDCEYQLIGGSKQNRTGTITMRCGERNEVRMDLLGLYSRVRAIAAEQACARPADCNALLSVLRERADDLLAVPAPVRGRQTRGSGVFADYEVLRKATGWTAERMKDIAQYMSPRVSYRAMKVAGSRLSGVNSGVLVEVPGITTMGSLRDHDDIKAAFFASLSELRQQLGESEASIDSAGDDFSLDGEDAICEVLGDADWFTLENIGMSKDDKVHLCMTLSRLFRAGKLKLGTASLHADDSRRYAVFNVSNRHLCQWTGMDIKALRPLFATVYPTRPYTIDSLSSGYTNIAAEGLTCIEDTFSW